MTPEIEKIVQSVNRTKDFPLKTEYVEAGMKAEHDRLASMTDEEMRDKLLEKETFHCDKCTHLSSDCDGTEGQYCIAQIEYVTKILTKVTSIFQARQEQALAEKDEEIAEWRNRCHDAELGNSARDRIQEGHEADKQQAVKEAVKEIREKVDAYINTMFMVLTSLPDGRKVNNELIRGTQEARNNLTVTIGKYLT